MADDIFDQAARQKPAQQKKGDVFYAATPSATTTEAEQVAQRPDAVAQARKVKPVGLIETRRAMQHTMGSTPMFTDVPTEEKESFESAGRRGYATGAKAGVALLALPSLIAAPVPTALSLLGGAAGGYVGGAAGREGAKALGASDYDAETAEDVGGVIGGFAGGYGASKLPRVRASISRAIREPLTGKPMSPYKLAVEKAFPDTDAVARAQAQATPINEKMRTASSAEFADTQSEIEASRQKELADMERLKEQDAQARMRRGAQQSRMDTANEQRLSDVEQARQAELADQELLKEQDAQSRTRRGLAQDALDRRASVEARKNALAVTPKILSPSEIGGPRMIGSEGRAATWTNERVMELAGKGNREAIQQAVRRGMELPPGARYVMGDPDFSRTVYNPRESTTFTPEGEPIRNLETPEKSSRARIAQPEEGATPKEIINASTGEVTQPQVPLAEAQSPGAKRPLGLMRGPYTESEKVATMSAKPRDLGPEFNAQQWQEEIRRNQEILRNPRATAEERAIAEDRLRDAREGAAKQQQ